jgi:hypothetical protein
MSTSGIDLKNAAAKRVTVSEDSLVVELSDGRTIAVPVTWFPRLLHGTPAELSNWRLIGSGEGIHWPDLDEDISVASLLAGRRSSETGDSLRRWLEGRVAK